MRPDAALISVSCRIALAGTPRPGYVMGVLGVVFFPGFNETVSSVPSLRCVLALSLRRNMVSVILNKNSSLFSDRKNQKCVSRKESAFYTKGGSFRHSLLAQQMGSVFDVLRDTSHSSRRSTSPSRGRVVADACPPEGVALGWSLLLQAVLVQQEFGVRCCVVPGKTQEHRQPEPQFKDAAAMWGCLHASC